ncbi:PREDICTED: lysosome-associated membrane glycoprotein 2-like [Branchiostoma belcheri]|uniref:Lysosome-associated membrane glycoprotein 2-like n=1 Tax=Branchiostoma belcheri TaxID=7741 RepID=A0A6P4ZRR1_BRABE|nr:PREDICTED: lysosome-associated membrane glycoprotein 2-like [Branchiostoma belcheri]
MGLQFKILYTTTDDRVDYAVFNLPQTANATGSCGTDNSSLTLTFHGDTFSVTFDFVKTGKGGGVGRFHASAIKISYTELPAIFPGTKNPNTSRQVSNNTLNVFSAATDKSYMCESDVNVTVAKDVSVVTSQVQVQPFGVKSGQFSTAQICSQDTGNKTSLNTAAIVIGVIAGVVVLGGVFAYVILSERKRRSYASIND